MAEVRVCSECGGRYPLTRDHWHKSKDGWHTKCRNCRNKADKRGRDKVRHKKLREIEKGAVDTFIAAARIGGANIPHSSEVLECMMRYFGGVEGFSRAFMKQFFDAPAGGAFRTKQLDSVLRLIVSNTAMGGSKKPLDLMTEEELEAQYRRDVLAAALAIKVNGKPVGIEVKDEVPEVPLVRSGSEDGGPGGVPPVPADSGRVERGRGEQEGGGLPLPDGVHNVELRGMDGADG